MRHRVAVLHQGFVPIYRVKFFESVNQVGETAYVVYHGAPLSHTGHHEVQEDFDFPNVRVKNRVLSFLGYQLVYQPVIQHVVMGSYDGVVLGHEVKFLSSLILFLSCKLTRKPVIWWGHGFAKTELGRWRFPIIGKFVERVKHWLAQSADGYLVYSEGGKRRLSEAGVPGENVTVLRNTIDIESELELYERFNRADPDQIRKELGLTLNTMILLYVGRVYKEKRIEELLELVARMNRDQLCKAPIEAVIIGDGPELKSLKTLTQSRSDIQFTGAIYEPEVVAKYMRVAAAMVIPGKVGLAVNHAFAHGLPVITRDHQLHAPELEYLDPGVNGLIVSGDFEAFLKAVVECLNTGHYLRMADAALQTREQLTLDYMVRTFHDAVSAVLVRCKGKT